jgi:hypothetical protein
MTNTTKKTIIFAGFAALSGTMLLASCSTAPMHVRAPASVSAGQATRIATLSIETAILSPDPFAGMKSRHQLFIDFDAHRISQGFETGTTDFFGISLNSVRDNFRVLDIGFSADGTARFRVSGETASGVGIVPNINYRFHVEARPNGEVKIAGCHDGYPGYLVRYDGREIYRFRHQPRNLIALFGSCDIKVD